MRIALLHYSAPPIVGGVESVLAHHARLMQKAGHQVVILAGRGAAFDERIPVRVLPRLDSRHPEVLEVKSSLDQGICPPAFDTLRNQIASELTAELDGVDVLIAHNVASLNKNLALTAALFQAYRLPGFPRLIIWHHDLAWTTPRYASELYSAHPWDLLRYNWPGAWHVVVSQLRRQELSALLKADEQSIRVIPNGVDLNAFYKLEDQTIQLIERLSLLEADPLMLLPVRLTPRKNIELALHVLAELKKTFPNAMLIVTGPEGPHNPANAQYKKKLLQIRDALNLQGSAHFLAEVSKSFMPDAVISDFYRLSDVLFFPSQEEGFGIPIIEAAFSGMPVFCSNIPVLRELGGADASYFEPDDAPEDITAQITQRLQNEATSRLARRAKRSYAWNKIYTQQIEPFLQEVIS